MIKIVIPLAPITKKNSSQILVNKTTNRPFIMPSKRYKTYEEEAGWYIKCKNENISYPVNIKCLFYMPTKRKVDLSNLISAAMDLLVHYKVIEDDNCDIVISNDGSRVRYDKEFPRSEIYIEDYGVFMSDMLRNAK